MADVIPEPPSQPLEGNPIEIIDPPPTFEIKESTGNVVIGSGDPRGFVQIETKTPILGRLLNLILAPWTYLFLGRVRL